MTSHSGVIRLAPRVFAVRVSHVEGWCGLLVGDRRTLVIDAGKDPEEGRSVAEAAETMGRPASILAYTHGHWDHVRGGSAFAQAEAVIHAGALASALHELDETRRPETGVGEGEGAGRPSIILTGEACFELGGLEARLIATPGHAPGAMSLVIPDARILFAGDMMMPLPHFVDGDPEQLAASLQMLPGLGLENVVQGHGELVLRGEIDDAVRANLKYLDCVRRKVEQVVKRGRSRDAVREIDIESCGKSRIPLNGLVTQLHTANLLAQYDRVMARSG